MPHYPNHHTLSQQPQNNRSGLNTNPQSGANDITVISDGVTAGASGPAIIPEGTASAKTNTGRTKAGSGASEAALQTPDGLSLPVANLLRRDLPDYIFEAIDQALGSTACHFVAVAPNCTGAVVTPDDIAGLPHGYLVMMVFNSCSPFELPETHEAGQIYIVP